MREGTASPSLVSILADALALRRYRLKTARPDTLNPSDMLVLGLLVAATRAISVVVQHEPTATALAAAFRSVKAFEALHLASSEDAPPPRLWLVDVDDRKAPKLGARDFGVLYGCESGFRADRGGAAGPHVHLYPLSFCAPALWQTRLLWLSAASHEDEVCTQLRRLLNDDMFDPLRLYELVQTLQDKSESGPAASDDAGVLQQQVRLLQARVRELEQAGLVRHHLAATLAAARERNPS